jgi:hypothetical protein
VRISAILVAACLLAVAAPAAAWKGELASGVRPIAEVTARAESGDYVMVEGEITEVTTGSGSRRVVTLEDGSGSVLVRVPSTCCALNGGVIPGSEVACVWAAVDRALPPKETWGIHAQTAERVGGAPRSVAASACRARSSALAAARQAVRRARDAQKVVLPRSGGRPGSRFT